jgi:hypothetical protein
MKRRDFIPLLAGLMLAAPRGLRAQTTTSPSELASPMTSRKRLQQ